MKAHGASQLTSHNADSQRSLRSLDNSEPSGGMRSPPGAGALGTDGTIDQPVPIFDDESNGPSPIKWNPQSDGRLGKRDFETYTTEHDSQESVDSQASVRMSWARMEAYNAMMRNLLGRGEGGWESIALISTGQGHSREESELGDG